MQRIIVIGAAAGGGQALMQLTAALPADFPLPVLVVLHVGPHPSLLPTLLSRTCRLPVSHAVHGEAIESGHIYVAPPDHHLLVEDGRTVLTRGPKEHHTRPAVDPLFRSAALAYGRGAIGVVLTGQFDDGTSGLQAIKRAGGTTVVQDPDEAFVSSMPESALRHAEIDHCVSLALMPALFASLASQEMAAPDITVPEANLDHEHELSLRRGNALEHLRAIAKPTTFACPDCHGGLWEILDSRPQRYRCHTGHAFTLRTLEQAMSEGADDAIQNALRALQEKRLLLEHMAEVERADGSNAAAAAAIEAAAIRLKRQAEVLQELDQDTDPPALQA